MKNNKLSMAILLWLFALVTTAFNVPYGFTITGEITGLEEGVKIELVPGASYKSEKPLATTIVQNGKFTLTGKVEGPRYFLIMVQGSIARGIMIENNQISVKGTASLNESNGRKRYLFSEIKVTGSIVNEILEKKLAVREMLTAAHEAYNKRGEEIVKKVHVARAAKDTGTLDSLLKTPAYKAFENDEREFFNTAKSTMNKLYTENRNTWWGPFLMLNTLSYVTPEQRPVFDAMSATAKNSYYGQILKEEVYPVGFLGKQAPLIRAKTKNNNDADFSRFFKSHQYTLIDFWASWCVPCRKALPGLKTFYQESKGKGIEIVSISIDKSESDWIKADTEEQFKWASYLDISGSTADAWKVKAIPAMFLIDQQGRVVGENLTMEQLKDKLGRL